MSQVLISGLVSTNQVNRWSARNIRPVNSSWSLSYIYGRRFGTKRLLKILSGKKYLPSTWIGVPEKKSLFHRFSLGFGYQIMPEEEKEIAQIDFCFCFDFKKICWRRFLAVFKRNCTGREADNIPSAEYSQDLTGRALGVQAHISAVTQIVQRLGKVLRSYLQMSVWNWTLQCYYYWYVRKIEGTNHVIWSGDKKWLIRIIGQVPLLFQFLPYLQYHKIISIVQRKGASVVTQWCD